MNIKPIKNKHYDCYTANMITIAKYFKKDYDLYLANLYFGFSKDRSLPIGLNMHSAQIKYDNNDFSDCSQLLLSRHTFNEIKDITSFIKTEITMKNSIIQLYTDVFYCPWNRLYKKRHIDHLIIITGYQNGKFSCLDPYFTEEVVTIETDNDIFGLKFCYVVRPINTKTSLNSKKKLRYLLYFLDAYENNMYEPTISENFLLLKESLSDIDIPFEIGGEFNIYDIPIARALKVLEDNRLSYYELLTNLEKIYICDFNQQKRELLELQQYYKKLRALMLKCFIRQDFKNRMQMIHEFVDEISYREIDLVVQLKNKYKKIIEVL